jgi:hypothetical protein
MKVQTTLQTIQNHQTTPTIGQNLSRPQKKQVTKETIELIKQTYEKNKLKATSENLLTIKVIWCSKTFGKINMGQLHLFATKTQLEKLTKLCDPLTKANQLINWETFRKPIKTAIYAKT